LTTAFRNLSSSGSSKSATWYNRIISIRHDLKDGVMTLDQISSWAADIPQEKHQFHMDVTKLLCPLVITAYMHKKQMMKQYGDTMRSE
jgi:hypothetical protein